MNKFAVLLTGLVFLMIVSSCTGKKSTETSEGIVQSFVGDVLIAGKKASVDAPVPDGSEVTTGKDSSCDIVFNEKNIIHILNDSDIVFDVSKVNKTIKVNTGGIACVLRNLNPSKSAESRFFTVETSVSIASVRGTSFFVKMEDDKNAYICDCNGAVDLSEKNGTNSMKVEAVHHKAFRFGIGDKGLFYQDAGLLYHDDKFMEDAAGKINEKIDWTKPE